MYIALKLSDSPMQEVNASIITIGDELLIGQTIDTNSAFIAQQLNSIGIWVKRRVAIGDDAAQILQALKEQSSDCSVIIITGGLGPTADDITKPTLCTYFNSRLIEDQGVKEHVTAIFAALGRPLLERNLKQAEVPEACTVLHNSRGTAPGMWFEKEGVIYVSLPGVPHEMKGLITGSVLPRLQERLLLPALAHRTLLTGGAGESTIADRLEGFEAALPSFIKLAYLPAYGMVRLRLTARGESMERIEQPLIERFHALQALVSEWLLATEDLPLAEVIRRKLVQRGQTLSTAESCTGGNIAQQLTSMPGSSAMYQGSVVAYANSAKEKLLGVSPQVLNEKGAVSEETVRAMASGALEVFGTDFALATSGIMGPDGGSAEKPVGTVWIAVAGKQAVKAQRFHFRFDRSRNIELATQTALMLLYRFLLESRD
jgi:nicotinamide-nucleotide amidase